MTIHSGTRRLISPLLAAALALLAVVAVSGTAQASAYRYWSYWQGSTGTWVAAMTGPGDYSVVDRDVQGWRFGITADLPSVPPDNSPDFATLCPQLAADTPPAGAVRVAVVVDAGFVADAPSGQVPPADSISCVTVPEGASGNQALAAAVSVTDEQGLVCSIGGYPQGECTSEVADADAAAAAQAAKQESANPATPGASQTSAATESAGNPLGAWAPVAGIAAVAALVVATVAVVRSRRRPESE